MIDGVAWIVVLVQILCVDLLLGADNAVVIALACSRLPAEETRRAVVLGAVGAIALRLGMLAFANALLAVPLVKLIAAWTLVVIALNVRARKAGDERPAAAGAAGDFITAAAVIMLADAAMSLDNVVALAAIAGGSFWLLALGVVLSIPIIAFGSLILSGIIRRAPAILTLGAVGSRLDSGSDGGFRSPRRGLVPNQRAGACRLRSRPRRRLRLARRRGGGTTLAPPRNRASSRGVGRSAART